MASVLILNRPNLNLMGTRKPEVYGTTTLADVEKLCADAAAKLGLDVDFKQSNHEGQLIDWIHETGAAVKAGESIGAVFNPGAFTHTSAALHDAIEGASLPLIECHISNVHKREEFRHHSFISPVASGIIVGFGVYGYVLAIHGLHHLSQAS
jgi:3-dehydroquinate dehydratase II